MILICFNSLIIDFLNCDVGLTVLTFELRHISLTVVIEIDDDRAKWKSIHNVMLTSRGQSVHVVTIR